MSRLAWPLSRYCPEHKYYVNLVKIRRKTNLINLILLQLYALYLYYIFCAHKNVYYFFNILEMCRKYWHSDILCCTIEVDFLDFMGWMFWKVWRRFVEKNKILHWWPLRRRQMYWSSWNWEPDMCSQTWMPSRL